MDPITLGLLVGAGGGLIQGMGNDRKSEQEAALKAQLAQYAPYSQMAATMASQAPVERKGQTEGLFSGAATGAQMGAGYDQAQADKLFKQQQLDNQTRYLNMQPAK